MESQETSRGDFEAFIKLKDIIIEVEGVLSTPKIQTDPQIGFTWDRFPPPTNQQIGLLRAPMMFQNLIERGSCMNITTVSLYYHDLHLQRKDFAAVIKADVILDFHGGAVIVHAEVLVAIHRQPYLPRPAGLHDFISP